MSNNFFVIKQRAAEDACQLPLFPGEVGRMNASQELLCVESEKVERKEKQPFPIQITEVMCREEISTF